MIEEVFLDESNSCVICQKELDKAKIKKWYHYINSVGFAICRLVPNIYASVGERKASFKGSVITVRTTASIRFIPS